MGTAGDGGCDVRGRVDGGITWHVVCTRGVSAWDADLDTLDMGSVCVCICEHRNASTLCGTCFVGMDDANAGIRGE